VPSWSEWVVSMTPIGLEAPERLRAAVAALLATLTWPASTTPPGLVALRLKVDARGNVTSVERVTGDARVAATLVVRLGGLKGRAKASRGEGTLVVTIRFAI
jgi:hypothetical protein